MRVELERIGVRFHRVQALADVTTCLPSGSRTALIGPNGSGKSTLTRRLLGLVAGDGRVRFDGAPAAAAGGALARRIAYVPQVAPRLAARVDELVAAFTALRGGGGGAPLRAVAARLGLDLAALGGRALRALSGGQRQKLLVAAALASGADLLVFDEPTASMDAGSRAAFFALVAALPPSTTVLLCSHRLDEIRALVDRVLVLEDGRLAFDGSAADYLAAHAEAVVEVEAAGAKASAWLRGAGFVRGAGDWWRAAVPLGERVQVVRTLVRALDGEVVDVVARDVERLELRARGKGGGS